MLHKSLKIRTFSTKIFDRNQLLLNKILSSKYKNSNSHRSFFDLPLLSLSNKLLAVNREFPELAFIGPNPAFLLSKLDPYVSKSIKKFHICDFCQDSLTLSLQELGKTKYNFEIIPHKIEHETWDFKEKSFDGIISNLQLHWSNDLHSDFIRIYDSLKSDGMFMFSLIGGNSLNELKLSFTMAEQEREGGNSPVIAPMVRITELGDLLVSTGYKINTTDKIQFSYEFETMFDLLKFLQIIGESNILNERRKFKSKDTFIGAAAVYQTLFNKNIVSAMQQNLTDKIIPIDIFMPKSTQKPHKNSIISTIEILYGIGWKEPKRTEQKKVKKDDFSLQKFIKELKEVGDVRYGTISSTGELKENK